MARASTFHGRHRLPSPPSANADLVVATLAEFGFASLQISRDDLNGPNKVVQLGVKPNRIDLITSITGVEFDQAWENRVPGSLDGIPVSYISLEDLIQNKESTGRPKDKGDAAELKKRRPG